MKNLEQVRAASAMAYARADVDTRGAQGGEVVKKLPAIIMTNGLLAAGAFAMAKRGGWETCFDALATHLADSQVGIAPTKVRHLVDIIDYLSRDADSATLKLATEEALAWLAFAKRFVRKTQGEEDEA